MREYAGERGIADADAGCGYGWDAAGDGWAGERAESGGVEGGGAGGCGGGGGDGAQALLCDAAAEGAGAAGGECCDQLEWDGGADDRGSAAGAGAAAGGYGGVACGHVDEFRGSLV